MKCHSGLFQKLPLFILYLFAGQLVMAQSTFTGTVKSVEDQKPLAVISVNIKHKSSGTTTDEEGAFSIKAAVGDTLVFTGISVLPKEVPLTESRVVTVFLDKSNKSLEEVVVTALGIKKEVKKLGYAVQEVKGSDVTKARDQNPLTGLVGKVAGLSVGPSAEMLSKPLVLLRGNELSLYVVDGIPINSDTWNLSPDDIDTYTILKGPAAAALYGNRAQFGAILITTKKGNKAKAKGFTVEFNSTNSIDKGFTAFPRLQSEYGPGENGLYAFVDGKGGGLNDGDYDVWGPKFNGQLIPQYDGKYDPTKTYTTTFPGGLSVTGNIAPTPWVARGKNNLQNFVRTGFQTTNNIALSAAGEKYNMRFSVSQSYQQSIIPNMELNITNFNIYAAYNPSKKLKLETNFNYNRQYTPNIPDVDYGPNSLIYNIAIWTGADWDVNAPDIRGVWKPNQTNIQSVFAEYQRYHNPWLVVNDWLRGHYKTDLYGYVSANYKFDEHINLTARTQLTGYDLLRTEQLPYSAHPYGREQNLGDYREDRRSLFENNTDVLFNFNYDMGNFLNVSGLAGGTVRIFGYNSTFTSTDYLSVPNVYTFSNSLNPVQSSSFSSDMRVYSAYYSLDFSLGKYATLSTTGRVDKSSALQPTENTAFYPSVSLSSVLSDYIKLPDFISLLKIRGSYANVRGGATSATVGMAPFTTIRVLGGSPSGLSLFDYPLGYGNNYESPYNGPDYSADPNTYLTAKYYNGQAAANYTNNLYQNGLKPFTRTNYEQGLDIRFLKNRLGLSATAFQYMDGPQTLINPISTATGYSFYILNALKTEKTGYELSVTGTPFRNPNGFTWDVLANWSTFKDVYKELPPEQDIYNTFFKVGDRVDKFYGTAFVKNAEGKIIYDDSGYPIANPVRQYLGNLNPDFSWSIHNQFTWKSISLGFQFDGSVGGVISDYMHLKTMQGGRNIETTQGKLGEARSNDAANAGNPGYQGVYVGDGVVVNNGVPINYDAQTGAVLNMDALAFSSNTHTIQVQPWVSRYYGVDEANLMSKTFAKLREVTLGYDVPSSVLKNTFISKLTISLVARNLWYIYGDKRFKDVDLDQYNGATSSTVLQTPTTRRFGVNLNVIF